MIDWPKKKVLVTGGKGFLGSRVVEILKKKGANRIIAPGSKDCDLTKISNCRRIVKGVDIVFHLAGRVGGIGYNRDRPADIFYDNILMGTQLLDEAKKAKVEKLIALGTICTLSKIHSNPVLRRAHLGWVS